MSSPPLNDRDFAKLGGGTRQRWFLFSQIYIKKIFEKILVNQIFLICYEYISNNSYSNLDDGNYIRIVWSFKNNAVKTFNVLYIHKKFSTTGHPVAEILIKYNNNNFEVNDEVEKEPINIELTDQKTDPYNDKNSIDSKWSDLTEENEEDIALANFIECLNKANWWENFSKKVIRWLQYRT